MGIEQNFLDWQQFGNSIFSEMTQLAQKEKAVNLAQGFPDFSAPHSLLKAASDAILQDKNQYAASMGVRPLRVALCEHYKRHFGVSFDADLETTVFSGATEAIWCAVGALVKPHDEVIVLAPTFDIYPAAIFGAKANMRVFSLNSEDWSMDFDEMKKLINSKTKAIVINNPMNPLGKVFNLEELRSIANLAIENDLIVISDEVYDHLVFDSAVHIPLHSLPGMRERTVTISSAAKTFSVTGWKVGYAFASEKLTARLRLIHQFTVFCSATPLQWALGLAFEEMDQSIKELRLQLAENRLFLHSILKDVGFKPSPCHAGYFITASFKDLSSKSDLDFARELTEKKKVATIPLSSFYFQREYTGYLRFAFCKKKETLEEAARNLQA